MQNLRRETLLLAQQSQQQMLGPDMLVVQALRFFGAVSQNPFAFMAQRKIDRRRNLLPDCGMPFDLLSDGIHGRVRPQESIGQLFIFPQEPEKQMLGLDVRAAELACLVPGEEDDAPRLFRVTLKHVVWLPPLALELYTIPTLLKILSALFPLQNESHDRY